MSTTHSFSYSLTRSLVIQEDFVKCFLKRQGRKIDMEGAREMGDAGSWKVPEKEAMQAAACLRW